jgi:hypothetical protein
MSLPCRAVNPRMAETVDDRFPRDELGKELTQSRNLARNNE